MKTFFTSDTHFGHANIISHCSRPFATVEEMDETMIRNWNAVVGPEDIVWHLGDFCMNRASAEAGRYRARLNGTIHLVWGNHDQRTPDFAALFASAQDLAEVKVALPRGDNKTIVLCHYAMREWRNSFRGAWHLFGHSHGSLTDAQAALALDIGVDCWDFRPVSVDDIALRMAKKKWSPTYGPAVRNRVVQGEPTL